VLVKVVEIGSSLRLRSSWPGYWFLTGLILNYRQLGLLKWVLFNWLGTILWGQPWWVPFWDGHGTLVNPGHLLLLLVVGLRPILPKLGTWFGIPTLWWISFPFYYWMGSF